MPIAVTLTAGAPEQDFDAPAFARAPRTLLIFVSRIDNPSNQAFTVTSSVRSSKSDGGLTTADIGSVTPYPSDHPGTFALSVSDAAKEIFIHGEGRARVRLSLRPISAEGRLAEPLHVTFSKLVWR